MTEETKDMLKVIALCAAAAISLIATFGTVIVFIQAGAACLIRLG